MRFNYFIDITFNAHARKREPLTALITLRYDDDGCAVFIGIYVSAVVVNSHERKIENTVCELCPFLPFFLLLSLSRIHFIPIICREESYVQLSIERYSFDKFRFSMLHIE